MGIYTKKFNKGISKSQKHALGKVSDFFEKNTKPMSWEKIRGGLGMHHTQLKRTLDFLTNIGLIKKEGKMYSATDNEELLAKLSKEENLAWPITDLMNLEDYSPEEIFTINGVRLYGISKKDIKSKEDALEKELKEISNSIDKIKKKFKIKNLMIVGD